MDFSNNLSMVVAQYFDYYNKTIDRNEKPVSFLKYALGQW